MSRHQLNPIDADESADDWPLTPVRRRGRRARWGRRGLLLLTVLFAVAAVGRVVLSGWGGSAADATVLRPAAAGEATPGAAQGAGGGAASNAPSQGGANTAAAPSAAAASSAEAGQTAPPSQGPIAGGMAVHVVGQVRRPGIYRLPVGSLVDDAVRAAGGLTAKAAPDSVNLAAPISSGTQLRILDRQQAEAAAGVGGGTSASPPAGEPGGLGTGSGPNSAAAAEAMGGAGDAKAAADGPVDLNSAGPSELQELPGIGPALAQRIIDFRQTNGRFARPQDLDAVRGIGPKLLAKLTPLVTCG